MFDFLHMTQIWEAGTSWTISEQLNRSSFLSHCASSGRSVQRDSSASSSLDLSAAASTVFVSTPPFVIGERPPLLFVLNAEGVLLAQPVWLSLSNCSWGEGLFGRGEEAIRAAVEMSREDGRG